ncbi:MAG: hypothetical protein M1812_005517 [Candelaria pacifica]|nr:MAG: hypothetical protein M1812_005517 [Candelaria pacifica]
MDVSNLNPLIDQLDDNIDDLQESLQPLLQGALSDTVAKLPLLDKAKLYILVTYAIESMIFSFLRLNGVKAKEHSIFRELARVKQYFEKIKHVENGGNKRDNLSLDKQAAGRFIKRALAGNTKYDLERAEQQAKIKAKQHIRFEPVSKKRKADNNETLQRAGGAEPSSQSKLQPTSSAGSTSRSETSSALSQSSGTGEQSEILRPAEIAQKSSEAPLAQEHTRPVTLANQQDTFDPTTKAIALVIMPRQRRGAATPSRNAPARPTAAPAGRSTVTPPQPQNRNMSTAQHLPARTNQPVAPAKGQAPAQQGSGLFGQMASTAAGVAVGSSIGHAIGGFFGGGSSAPAESQENNMAAANPSDNANYQSNSWGGGNCEADVKQFTQCMDQNQGNMQICGWYLDQLKACQAASSQY